MVNHQLTAAAVGRSRPPTPAAKLTSATTFAATKVRCSTQVQSPRCRYLQIGGWAPWSGIHRHAPRYERLAQQWTDTSNYRKLPAAAEPTTDGFIDVEAAQPALQQQMG